MQDARTFILLLVSCFLLLALVGLSGFEPLTSRLSGVRSNQLSYRPQVQFFRTGHQADSNIYTKQG
jgi:hypothetical protein